MRVTLQLIDAIKNDDADQVTSLMTTYPSLKKAHVFRYGEVTDGGPLHLAAYHSAQKSLKYLLTVIDPDTRDGLKHTSLFFANHPVIVNLLCDSGVPINVECEFIQSGHDGTALVYAIRRNNYRAVKALLSRNADVSERVIKVLFVNRFTTMKIVRIVIDAVLPHNMDRIDVSYEFFEYYCGDDWFCKRFEYLMWRGLNPRFQRRYRFYFMEYDEVISRTMVIIRDMIYSDLDNVVCRSKGIHIPEILNFVLEYLHW